MSKKRSAHNTKAFKKVTPQPTRGSLITDICNLAILATREIENGNGYTKDSPDALLSFVVKSYLDSEQEHIIISSMEKLMDSGHIQPAVLLDSIADALADTVSDVYIRGSDTDDDPIALTTIDTHLFIVPMLLQYSSEATTANAVALDNIELRKCLTNNRLLSSDDLVNSMIDITVSPALYNASNLPISFTERRQFITAIHKQEEQNKEYEHALTPSRIQANAIIRFMVFTVKGDADYLDTCGLVNQELTISSGDETCQQPDNILQNFAKDVSALIKKNNQQIIDCFVSFPSYLRDGISVGVNLWNNISLELVLAELTEMGEKPDKAYFDFVDDNGVTEIHIAIHSTGKRVDAKWTMLDGDFESAAESIMEILKDNGVTDIYMPAEEPKGIDHKTRGMRLH